jgi:hypothetical protein
VKEEIEMAKVTKTYDVTVDSKGHNEFYTTIALRADDNGLIPARVFVMDTGKELLFEQAHDWFLSECGLLEDSEDGFVSSNYVEENYTDLLYLTHTNLAEYEENYNIVVNR